MFRVGTLLQTDYGRGKRFDRQKVRLRSEMKGQKVRDKRAVNCEARVEANTVTTFR